jgi:hypothetical protein
MTASIRSTVSRAGLRFVAACTLSVVASCSSGPTTVNTSQTKSAPSRPSGGTTTGVVPTRPVEDGALVAQEAFVYLYPLVLMDVTRRQATNSEAGAIPGRGPVNAFTHMRSYPTAAFREVVSPNFDTLYSTAWLDLTGEPMVVSVPDTNGRYYLMPLLDMWTEVFAVPGKRATGTRAGEFAIVPQGWKGELPARLTRIEAPTPYVWVIGRTQTNGPKDYEAVHAIQAGYRVTPLSRWPKAPDPPRATIDPAVDMKTPPAVQVSAMPAEKFFSYAAQVMKTNPPHATDWSALQRFRRIGLVAGQSYDVAKLDPVTRKALATGAAEGLKTIQARVASPSHVVYGWQFGGNTVGVYGTDYLARASVAMVGLGANKPEDAIYPATTLDDNRDPLVGERRYVLHFEKSDLPPAGAFWSLTAYDKDNFPIHNPVDRYSVGDRDALMFNTDGTLDLYVQATSPGNDKERNWLPSTTSGEFKLVLRVYDPRQEALDGKWTPPAVKRMD